jgi:Spy/CpxP family protein refolding chaperone
MKKFLLTVIAISAMAFVSTSSAQEKKKGGKGGGMNIEQIEQAVGTLTADQKTKIEAILAKARTDREAAAGDADKMREIGQKVRTDIRAVLTPDQQKKFDEMPQGRGGKKKKDN